MEGRIRWFGAALAPAALLVVSAATGCGHTEKATISMVDIDCQSCGVRAAKALERRDDVEEARFDKRTAEIDVRYDAKRVRPETLLGFVRELGYAVEPGAGKGAWKAQQGWPEGADLALVSKAGEDVDLAAYLAPGKVTVFDFYADWCGPCRKVDAALRERAATDPTLAVRKVNVVDWDSPVAKRHLAGVPELPYVLVFGPSGERIDAIAGLDLDRMTAAIDRARVAEGGPR